MSQETYGVEQTPTNTKPNGVSDGATSKTPSKPQKPLIPLNQAIQELQQKFNGIYDFDNEQVCNVIEIIDSDLNMTDDSYGLVRFYTQAYILASLDLLNLSNIKGDNFEFGFKEFENIPLMLQSDGVEGSAKKLTNALRVSQLRQVSLANVGQEKLLDYITADINLLSVGLGISTVPVDDEMSEALEEVKPPEKIEDIKHVSVLSVPVEKALDQIKAVYNQVLSQGYLLDPFAGLLIGFHGTDEQGRRVSVPAYTLNSNGGKSVLNDNFHSELAKFVNSTMVGVTFENNDREIDPIEIYNSKKPIYFINKMLEFSLGKNLLRTNYSKEEQVKLKEAKGNDIYLNKFTSVDNPIWEEFSKKIYEYLEEKLWVLMLHLVETHNVWGISELADVQSEHSLIEFPQEFLDDIDKSVAKFVNSVCTFAILKENVETRKGHAWASADWFISYPTELADFKTISGTKALDFTFKGEGVPEEPMVTTYNGVTGISVAVYRHVANEALANSIPLFAYKVYETLEKKKVKINRKKSLIGKALDGSLLYSEEGGRIDLTSTFVHVLTAGSRMGKGVQTASQLLPSIVEGIPMFPHDNKPDTFLPFAAMCGFNENGSPKGYFINGSHNETSVSPSTDPKTLADFSWKTSPKFQVFKQELVPAWLLNGVIKDYSEYWGTIAYTRSTMLTMGISIARNKLAGSHDNNSKRLYELMGGDKGIAIVLDELTVHMEKTDLLMKAFARLTYDYKKDWEKYRTTKIKYEADLTKPADKQDVLKKANYEAALEAVQSIQHMNAVYLSDLLNTYNQSASYLKMQRDAGFTGKESKRSNLFIICQSFPLLSDTGDIVNYEENKDGQISKLGSGAFMDSSKHPLYTAILSLGSDLIMGGAGKGGQSIANTSEIANGKNGIINGENRRFVYTKDLHWTQYGVKSTDPKDPREQVFNPKNGKAIYFKPFLTLGDYKGEPVRYLEIELKDKTESVKARYSDENGNWNKKIAVTPLIESLGVGGKKVDPTVSFMRAAEIADMAVKALGYEDGWFKFLLDLRPEWQFTVEDVVDAIVSGDILNKAKAQPRWTEYNKLLGKSSEDQKGDTTTFSAETAMGISNSLADDLGFGEGSATSLSTENTSTNFSEDLETQELPSEDTQETGKGETNPWDISHIPTASSYANQLFSKDDLANLEKEEGEFEEQVAETKQPIDVTGGNATPIGGGYRMEPLDDKPMTDFNSEQFTQSVVNSVLSALGAMGILDNLKGSSGSGGFGFTQNMSNLNDMREEASGFKRLSRVERSKRETHLSNFSSERPSITYRNYMSSILAEVHSGIGYDRVSRIAVVDGRVFVNGVEIGEPFEADLCIDAPIDVVPHLVAKRYAYAFPWAYMKQFSNLQELSIDSSDFLFYTFMPEIKMPSHVPISKLFDRLPNLRLIRVEDKVITREMANEQLSETESFLTSYRRRNTVMSHGQARLGGWRKDRWNATKQAYTKKQGMSRAVGVSANLIGAGVSGLAEGTTATARGINNGVSKLKALSRYISQEWRNDYR